MKSVNSGRGLAAFILLAFVLAAASTSRAEVDKRLVEAGRRATVYVVIEVPKGLYMGSGFCIDTTGIFITNNHVVEPLTKEKNAKIYLIVGPGTKAQRIYTPTVVKTDPARDVAVLRVDRPGPLEALELASPGAMASLRETSSVVAFGFPLGQALANKDSLPEITVTTGRVSALRHVKEQLASIQFDASVTHGNSGGPLIDEYGQVVGVVTAGVEGKQINFAGPVTFIRSILAQANIVLTPAVLTNNGAANDLIDWLTGDGKSGRAPAPSESVLKQNQKTLKDILAAQYADKSATAKYDLIVELLKRAAASKSDPPGRYAMLVEARELAIQTGDVMTAAYAVYLIGESYALKPADLMQDVVFRMNGHTSQPQDSAWVAALGMMLAEAKAKREEYAEARKILPIIRTNGIASRNPTVTAQMRDRLSRIEAAAAEYDRVQLAKTKLAATPADPDANLTVGRYLCFTRGQFDKGVPMLAKSADASLKSLASADMARPATPDAQKAVGDQWWDQATKETKNPTAVQMCKGRAGFWYLQALPKLTGLAKVATEKRMEEMPTLKADSLATARSSSPAADSQSPEDPLSAKLNNLEEWEIDHGTWTMAGSHIRGEGDTRLNFKTPLPDECVISFRMNVISGMRPRVYFHNSGIMFGNEGYSKELRPFGVQLTEGSPFPYKNGEEHLVTFRFAADSFEAEIDGKIMFKGAKKTAKQITLDIRAGDGWSKGTTEFWDFKLWRTNAGGTTKPSK